MIQGIFARDGQHLDPRQLLDLTASTALGPPVVAVQRPLDPTKPDQLLCVVGNHRVILTDYAKRNWAAAWARYRESLPNALAALGLPSVVVEPTGDDQQLLLVRILCDCIVDLSNPDAAAESLETLGQINRLSDASFTKARDPAALGYVYARELLLLRRSASDKGWRAKHERTERLKHAEAAVGLFDWLTNALVKYNDTKSFLADADGKQFLDRLLELGIIPSEEKPLFVRSVDQRPSALGTLCLMSMLFALAFDDPHVVDSAREPDRKRLEAALGHLICCRDLPDDWDVAADVGRACTLLGQATELSHLKCSRTVSSRRNAFRDLETLSDQATRTLFAAEKPSDPPEFYKNAAYARAWAGVLLCSDKHVSIRAVAQSFAEWRAAAHLGGLKGGQMGLFDGKPRSADEAFYDIFCPTADVAKWVRAQRSEPYHADEPRDATFWSHRVDRRITSLAQGSSVYHLAELAWTSFVAPPDQTRWYTRRPGRPALYSDQAIFAAAATRALADDELAEAIVSQFAGPSARQCRRRIAAWRRDPRIWPAVLAVVPELK